MEKGKFIPGEIYPSAIPSPSLNPFVAELSKRFPPDELLHEVKKKFSGEPTPDLDNFVSDHGHTCVIDEDGTMWFRPAAEKGDG